MTKEELIRATAIANGIKIADAAAIINTALDFACKALERGDTVKMHNFGTFERRRRAARIGRNINTGETIPVPAADTVFFKPSEALKRQMQK